MGGTHRCNRHHNPLKQAQFTCGPTGGIVFGSLYGQLVIHVVLATNRFVKQAAFRFSERGLSSLFFSYEAMPLCLIRSSFFSAMLRHCPWKYTKYSLRPKPRLTKNQLAARSGISTKLRMMDFAIGPHFRLRSLILPLCISPISATIS